MSKLLNFTVPYFTDTDREVNILIRYSEELLNAPSITPMQRLNDGGFTKDDIVDCGIFTFGKSVLKPRLIYVDDENPKSKGFIIYVKDKATYDSLIKGESSIQSGTIRRYEGESFSL